MTDDAGEDEGEFFALVKKEPMFEARDEEVDEAEEEMEDTVSTEDMVDALRGLGMAGSAFIVPPRSMVFLDLGGGRGAATG